MSADAGWYEIWADEGLDPPYLLIVRSTGGGHVEVLDTRDGHRVVHVADSRRAVRSGNRPTPKQDNPDAQLGPHRGQANRATGEGVNRAPVTEKAANEFAAFFELAGGVDGTRKRTSQRIHVDPDGASEVGSRGCAVEGGAAGGELRREVDPGCNSVTAAKGGANLGAAMRAAADRWEATRDVAGLRGTLLAILRHLSSRTPPTD